MKLVIDISETYYSLCKVCVENNSASVDQSIIADGTPYDKFNSDAELKDDK